MSDKYHPETNDTPLLNVRGGSIYHGLISSTNWAIKLGRFDIQYATQALLQYSMAPREGHLNTMKQVFGYLKKYPKGKIVVDASYGDNSTFKINEFENWKEFYPDAKEELPDDMPTPFGKAMQITIYIDADHAHDTVTQCLITSTAILIFVNNTLI